MYEKAIEMYTKAIEMNPTVAAYYGNRSLAHLRTECFGYALEDASKALELDKNYIKGYYRRATAYMSLGKFKLALKDYETVKKAKPNDKDAQMKFMECNKIVKKIAFEKAIAVEDTKSIADIIDLESIGNLINKIEIFENCNKQLIFILKIFYQLLKMNTLGQNLKMVKLLWSL